MNSKGNGKPRRKKGRSFKSKRIEYILEGNLL